MPPDREVAAHGEGNPREGGRKTWRQEASSTLVPEAVEASYGGVEQVSEVRMSSLGSRRTFGGCPPALAELAWNTGPVRTARTGDRRRVRRRSRGAGSCKGGRRSDRARQQTVFVTGRAEIKEKGAQRGASLRTGDTGPSWGALEAPGRVGWPATSTATRSMAKLTGTACSG